MNFFQRFLSNHVLANLTFGLVIVLGSIAYSQMPRAKNPEVNFNWVYVTTVFPGTAAINIEQRITDPIEEALQRSIKDMEFVISTSRDSVSSILVRFDKLDERTFDERLIDLRREVQNTYTDKLPAEARDPEVYEVSTSNATATAMVVVTGVGDDENLRRQARNVKKDLEQIKGVDRVTARGLSDPELHVAFIPERLEGLGITPADISETVRAYFRDTSAGDLEVSDGKWVVRMQGTDPDPSAMRDFPIVTAGGVVPLDAIAELTRTAEEPDAIVTFRGQPAVALGITKQADANVLELVDLVNEYMKKRNRSKGATGAEVVLVDDQTVTTREALSLMQNNAAIGLLLVLLATWVFLGTRIAFLTSIGIPFTLAGTFLIISVGGFSLNNTVLLGVVIALGMIVDDAVVVIESVYYHLQRGMDGMSAIISGFREVLAPVTTSVMTTLAAFLPLTLLPGVVGDFMRVTPIVVSIALLVSLFEAYWILPAHVLAMKIDFSRPDNISRKRRTITHWVRRRYTQMLLTSLRHPIIALVSVVLVVTLALAAVVSGKVRLEFFAGDYMRLFYVNVDLPEGASLQDTSRTLMKVEDAALGEFLPGELRSSLSFAGQQFTETEPVFGDAIGQVMFSLNPQTPNGRHVSTIAGAVKERAKNIPGPVDVSILEIQDGPPTRRAVSAKLLGDKFPAILEAAYELRAFLESREVYRNITMDYQLGDPELVLRLDGEAIQRSGVNPGTVSRVLRAYVDGEIATEFQDEGEEVRVRVLPKKDSGNSMDNLMRQTISLPNGQSIALGELVTSESGRGRQNIRHYQFRRAITVASDLDKKKINTVQANNLILEKWDEIRTRHPDVSLDLSGELDAIQESIDSLQLLLLLGLGLIYIILGAQFRSYYQPFLVITTVPLAFTGVTIGLLLTQNPLSLYTMYGVVALTGISVNAAIVLISAANARRQNGMSLPHATVYAARRRVIPILITSLTTTGGILSLAVGIAGKSLIWGPVATAIVWGLAFSTALTLFVIPLLYRAFMVYSPQATETDGKIT